MINNTFKEEFFSSNIDNRHCTKRSPLAPVTCWNAMSEANSLRLTQQKTIKKFLNLRFGHKIAVEKGISI